MNTLHIINKSPATHASFKQCCQTATSGSSILFIEAGVLISAAHGELEKQLQHAKQQFKLYLLEDDLQLYGINDNPHQIQCIDYDGFVNLTVQHNPIHSWN